MAEDDDSLDGLRDAIRRRGEANTATEEQRFQTLAREHEASVAKLVAQIREVVAPSRSLFAAEDERGFTRPPFPAAA